MARRILFNASVFAVFVLLFLAVRHQRGQQVVASYLEHWQSTVPGIQQVVEAGQELVAPSHRPFEVVRPKPSDGTASQGGQVDDAEYLVGVGKADITGPVVEINLMGYANFNQLGSGLRQRLYSRAFIVADKVNPAQRLVYLVLDTQSGDTAITHGILEGLAGLGAEYALYNRSNVAVTGTHSHSGPAAWLNYLLPQVSSRGFSKQSYQAIVDGTLLSIRRAHESLEPGRLSFGWIENESSAELNFTANINRSPYAYLANPAEERERYQHNVDKTMTMLKFQRASDAEDIGVLTWFPVHGTSMLNNNTLISGDNKGVAAYLLEGQIDGAKSAAKATESSTRFVAGFSQSNVGDTTPNILGAYCEDGSGEQCSFKQSLCNGKNEPCHGRGPYFGLDDGGQKSCFEIGKRQSQLASELYSLMTRQGPSNGTNGWAPITGPVAALHTYRDFSNYTFAHPNGTIVRTCPAALGYSFAAGTSDGPGAFDFKQNNPGDPQANPIWAIVRNVIHAPGKEQIACQAPKPILLDAGETTTPYLWAPNVVDIQLMRIGPLVMIVSPGEATTMAGRRWKDAIASTASSMGMADSHGGPFVVLGGPANSYTHYIATEEEYGVQRYEGASTLYGPHTLNAYIKITTELLPYLSASHAPSVSLDPGPQPQVNTNRSLSLITPVIADSAGLLRKFGDVLHDVAQPVGTSPYKVGDRVSVVFVGANPRNNLRLEETFASVEKFNADDSSYSPVRDDNDWELIFEWKRTSTLLATSEVTMTWEITRRPGEQSLAGQYRLKYNGDSKALIGGVTSFVATSADFEIVD